MKEALDSYMDKIREILRSYERKDKFVMIGECGLDYDRLNYADKETQNLVFPRHFELTEEFNLPMYLHSRATGPDFTRIIKENRHRFPGGVVHSFTGTEEELNDILEMGLYVGINGCSLKTAENCEVVKKIPLDRLMLETDCPYCDIRNSHHSAQFVETKFPTAKKEKYTPDKMVKDRNEPCTIVRVVEAVSKLTGQSEEELCQIAWKNTLNLFQI
mmetsp:Transcript_1498/g.2642  ORF Transcript_1498/g.2642 Transcript_1498/m.2642 type:complete len:216 (+) Transcript_1498:412-1059(+)